MKKSLGIRCLEFMLSEMNSGVICNPNLPATPRVREYFSICTRLQNGKEVKMNLTSGNWCAAAVSFSLYKSLLPDEKPMHGYRVGCIEIQQDLIKSGNWQDKKNIQEKKTSLMLGDILITDRSTKDPATSWWRHILRVSKIIDSENFECISGNSVGGQYRISKHNVNDKNIVGFGLVDKRDKVISSVSMENKFPTDEKDLNPNIETFYDLYDQIFNK